MSLSDLVLSIADNKQMLWMRENQGSLSSGRSTADVWLICSRAPSQPDSRPLLTLLWRRRGVRRRLVKHKVAAGSNPAAPTTPAQIKP